MQKTSLLYSLLFVLFYWNTALLGQDTHYWTQQFGARSALLGGAVIHGLESNSAVYYNPATLAFIRRNTISLNTSLYKYEDITVKNGGGTGVDLQSQRISLYQNMISGLLTKTPEKRYRIGFNILTRTQTNFDFNVQYEAIKEIIASQDGEEFYLGNIELRTNINETWGCLGGGYRLSDNFSLGLTAIIAYRNHRHQVGYAGKALNTPDSASVANGASIFMASNTVDFDFRTNIVSLLFKAGFHARFGRFRFGLNLTTPSVGLWGQARVQREELQTNLPGNRDQLKADEQRYLRSQYRYPVTVGFGAAYIYTQGMISIASEYFGPVYSYEMIEANASDPTFPSFLSNGVEQFLTVYQGADPVINFGLGWEQEITKKIKLHLGVRTDFTYARTANRVFGLTPVSAPIDIYHFSAGVSFRRRASRISIGFNYSYANRNILQFVNLSEPVIDAQQRLFLFGSRVNNAQITAHSITAMIGYTYYFALK
jgi:hypothetical protein